MATFDLFSAVKDGDTDAVREELRKRNCRSKLNERNEWGDTVLHLAAEAGNSDVCQMLIAGGASVTVRNNRGETCLHRAAVGGHTDCVKAIVDRDNDPEAINSQNDAGYTALHHSAKHGSIELIQVLLRAGADRMLENNAGETPYMVAHKYHQFDAERLLLNIEQQHADKAIAEMNTKPKKITAAYSKALKYAHKPESRVRLVFIGDTGSGKTSLKKTLFGEKFEEEEPPTAGIQADPCICRIQFHQYREWVMQPSSQADANRLNLEYNDAIIDYILNEMRKPGVSDEVIDLKKLGIRKHKNVNFDNVLRIIPCSSLASSMSSSAQATMEDSGGDDRMKEDELDGTLQEEHKEEGDDDEEEKEESQQQQQQQQQLSSSTEGEDEMGSTSARGRQGTIVGQKNEEDSEAVEKANKKQTKKPSFFDSTLEMSKILLDHIPLEVLKRLVMRWPVDTDDATVEQDIANRRRLLLSVWDCSGDPVQLCIVPLFFSHRSIYLCMYDGSKPLTDPSGSYLAHNLTSADGTIPTNEQVLQEWLGCVLSHSVSLPSAPTPDSNNNPELPPVVFVSSHADSETRNPAPLQQFFDHDFYNNVRSHMIDEKATILAVSNCYEGEVDSYRSHHYLRREVEYIARQMPYIYDMIPVQWVRFEQLLFAIMEQDKVIIMLPDLERYIGDMCDIVGPLQVQPALAHFTDIGSIIHFHRHPALKMLIIIRPQWLIDALVSIFSSSSTNWITEQVRTSFNNLLSNGFIQLNTLLLAYRCSRLPPKYWNETLYFMNHMDLIACHPSLHESKSVYVPCMVSHAPPTFVPDDIDPPESDPPPIYFTTSSNVFPQSLYNQLVVHCIRNSSYSPSIYYEILHIRLNHTHHLVLQRDSSSLKVLVQSDTANICQICTPSCEVYQVDATCSGVAHLLDSDDNSPYSMAGDDDCVIPCHTSLVCEDEDSMDCLCHKVRSFLMEHLDFLVKCWYPGLELECRDGLGNVLDTVWVNRRNTNDRLAVWFNKQL